MNIILCLDDNFGMAFNNRRQSKDRCAREKILSLCGNSKLYMSEYSFSQFEEKTDNIIVDENFLDNAGNGDFCFIENVKVPVERAERLYIFFWNRAYPSDLKLDFNLIESGFNLLNCEEFKGYSHENITLKIYEKK